MCAAMEPIFENFQLLGGSIMLRFAEEYLKIKRRRTGFSTASHVGLCVSGQGVRELRRRIKYQSRTLHENVIVLIGTNNLLKKKMDRKTFRLAIHNLANDLKYSQKCRKAVVLTLPPIPLLEGQNCDYKNFNDIIRRLQKTHSFRVADVAREFVSQDGTVRRDLFQRFATKLSLDEHISSKHRFSNKESHPCHFCEKKFATEAHLENHVKKHTTNSLRAMRRATCRESNKAKELQTSVDNLEKSWYSDNDADDFNIKSDLDEKLEDVSLEDIKPKINLSHIILKNTSQKNEKGLYECICCPEEFANLSDLRKHTRKHTSFKCKICNKIFTIISNLRRHLRAHTVCNDEIKIETNSDCNDKSSDYKCISCGERFLRRKLLSDHLKTHTNFTCSICKAKFTFITNLRKHIKYHTANDVPRSWRQQPVEKRTCDICLKVFKYRPSMLKHRRKHSLRGKDCPYCTAVCENSIKLYKHMEEFHVHEKNIACKLCDKKFFREWNLKMHMVVHTGHKKFMCEICGMSFALGGNLSSHKRLHTGIKPYKCGECGKEFAQQAALRSHEAGHSDKRDYKCPDCGKGFSRIGAMKNHRKRHETIRPFDCPMCDRRFVFSSDQKRHMSIHTGERKHQCDICNKAFNRLTNLKVHKRIHTGEHPFRCDICDKGFVQAHGMKSHLKTHEKMFMKGLNIKKHPIKKQNSNGNIVKREQFPVT